MEEHNYYSCQKALKECTDCYSQMINAANREAVPFEEMFGTM